ncbi:hypothetical protein GCM10027443_26370 [Pontibacter brevis]
MYTRLPLKIRITIIAVLTALFIFTLAVTNIENLLGGLIGGVLVGLLISELGIYLQRRAE